MAQRAGGAASFGNVKPSSSSDGLDYGTVAYWDDRYEKQAGKIFDWVDTFEQVKPIFDQHILAPLFHQHAQAQGEGESSSVEDFLPTLKILNVGCGNSILPEELYDLGYRQVYSFDISAPCIETMATRNRESRPELLWHVMSCTSLDYDSDMFDVVIDKSTIDCLVCGKRAYQKTAQTMKECQRVLKPGGFFMSISFG